MKKKGGITGKGFDVNPQNINKKGRPPSIRKQIQKILEKEGKLPIPKKYLIDEDDEKYYFRVPNGDMLAMRLMSMAMSGNRNVSLKAIKMVMEYIDGKPTHNITVSGKEDFLTELKIIIDSNNDSET